MSETTPTMEADEKRPAPPPSPPADPWSRPPGGGRIGGLVTILIVAAAALALGVVFSDQFRALLGSRNHDHAATQPAGAGEQKQLWTCGMHPQVIQDTPGDCPICHMELTPLKSGTAAAAAPAGERKVKYWWDPMMNPPYISDQPGKSPMGMDLVPVYEDEVMAGPMVTIDPVVVQNMGVRVAKVERASIQQTVRAVGYLEEPEPLHRDINLRVNGWVEKLYADTDGMPITQGQPLFELYSPELQVAVEELIAARRSRESAANLDEQARRTAQTLYESSARKLELWGLTREQTEALAKLDRAPATIPFLAPISGHLTEKQVYEGAGVMSGNLVMRLADRHRMWMDAQVHEHQLPLVKIGNKARATIVSAPGQVFDGEVVFIHPHLDPATRTALVRIQIPNQDYHLRQGMYGTVEILSEPTPPAPVVPREAVIDTGTRQITFVNLGGGKFEPRQVSLGLPGNDGLVQVLSGVAPGEQVVTSGQFLLDSESRLKEAIQKHLTGQLASFTPSPAAQVGHGKPSPASQPSVKPAPPLDVPHTDEMAVAYLEIAQALGARQQTEDPVGVDRLLDVARTAASHAEGEGKALADAVVAATESLKGKPIAEQREAFIKVSNAMIALLDRSPQSSKVAPELFVVHCPMAFKDTGADWLQTNKDVANPYYATKMKSCGEVTRSIPGR